MDSRTPFATILAGQPTLRRMIKLGVLAALDQRITVRYHMNGMTPDETASYIRHHLKLAGRDDVHLFTDDSITQIHEAARGKPRRVAPACYHAGAPSGPSMRVPAHSAQASRGGSQMLCSAVRHAITAWRWQDA